MTLVAAAVAPMLSKHMALIFQMEQGPVVVVATQVDTAAMTTVAPVGASVGVVLHMAQVHRAPATLARAAVYFYIINKIGFSHIACVGYI